MSQVNLPNGIPPHLNGVDSSHSSRDSSPSARMYQHQHIRPASTGPIPQSQLPPVRQLAHNFAGLQVKQQQATPSSSPKAFSTSTPVPNELKPTNMSSTGVSPIGFSNVPLSNDPQAQLASRNTNVPSRVNNLPHQNSLPSAPGVNVRPQIQPSLSQPRLMGYNQNPGSQGSSLNASPARQVYANPQMNQGDGTNLNKAPPAAVNGAQASYSQGDFRFNNPAQIRPPLNKGMTEPPVVKPQTGYQYPQPSGVKPNMQDPAQMGYQYPQAAPVPPVVKASIPDNQVRTNLHANRYPSQQFNTNPIQQAQPYANAQPYMQQQYQQQQPNYAQKPQQPQYGNQNQNAYNYQPSVAQMGFNKLWGTESFDLLQTPLILPRNKVETPRISLGNELLDNANCHPDIFRCTMTKIPESNSLLQKSRLPLGVLIHPFRDLNQLPVIQCNTIVRCRACRTYINPFVFFVDNKRWKCNLCYRVNELPEEFQYDPVTKTYGDPSRRPEVKTSTIEYIAPAEYMLRPPQPAVYLFLLDVSRAAVESGYLHTACNVLSAELSNLPGDARTHIGFIAYNSALHFYSLADGLSQPHEMTVLDIDDIFLPCPDNLLVNLQFRMELVMDLLAQLPNRFNTSYDTGSALGAALQAAHKMMASTGGRVTVFQAALPTIGPGLLTAREDPSQRAGTEAQHLNPANDFYKRLALDCSGQQIAVDLFLINSQYVDVATISGISRFSGGCIYHFPLFKAARVLHNEAFERSLRRYLTRKIGFEAVMRIRCSRGLSIHTFHGNFFVRSTDLLCLPNVNPDAGFGMQVAIEENLSDVQTVCFQAALLYTSSKGERRIRVHTMCLPIVNNISDVINSADQQCIIGLLAKMAVDRSMQSNLSDAREAFINVAIDILSSYKLIQNMGSGGSALMAPNCLRLLPLYISALLKNTAFRTGISTRLDDRVKAMCDMKTRPLSYLIQQIYPDLYPVHNLQEQSTILNEEEVPVPSPPHLQLTARSIDSNGAYLMDTGDHMILIVCPAVSQAFLNHALGVPDYNSITDQMFELPVLENEHNQRLHLFINYLNEEKPMNATLQVMRDNSQLRGGFLEKLIEDRVETALSYHEFLQHLKTQVK